MDVAHQFSGKKKKLGKKKVLAEAEIIGENIQEKDILITHIEIKSFGWWFFLPFFQN